MLVADEIPQIILFKERGRDRTLRNEYKCRSSRQRVPSARVTKFVKEPLEAGQPPSPPLKGDTLAGDFTGTRERRREPLWRQRDNISELGEDGRAGREGKGEARSRSLEEKNSSAVSRKRDREAGGLHRNWFRKCRFDDKRRREGRKRGGTERERERRHVTRPHSRRAHLHVT